MGAQDYVRTRNSSKKYRPIIIYRYELAFDQRHLGHNYETAISLTMYFDYNLMLEMAVFRSTIYVYRASTGWRDGVIAHATVLHLHAVPYNLCDT